MTWIYTGEDPWHVRVVGLEDRAPDCTVRIEARNEVEHAAAAEVIANGTAEGDAACLLALITARNAVEHAIAAVDDTMAALQRPTKRSSTPIWLPALLIAGVIAYGYALIRVFETTIGRLLP